MNFNISELVSQKTKELVEKIILEYWYNTAMSIEKYVLEKNSGRYESLSNIRSRLHTLISSLRIEERKEMIEKIKDQKTKFEDLFEMFLIAQEHLQNDGLLNYESEKGYHSEFEPTFPK